MSSGPAGSFSWIAFPKVGAVYVNDSLCSWLSCLPIFLFSLLEWLYLSGLHNMFMTQLSQDKVVYFLTATVLFLLIVTLPNEPGLDCMFSSGTLATETMPTFENSSGFNRGLMEPKNWASRRTWTRLEGTSCTRSCFSTLPHSFQTSRASWPKDGC